MLWLKTCTQALVLTDVPRQIAMSGLGGVGCGQGDIDFTHFIEIPDIWEHLKAQGLVSCVGWTHVLMSLQRFIAMGHLRGTDACPQWVHGCEEDLILIQVLSY